MKQTTGCRLLRYLLVIAFLLLSLNCALGSSNNPQIQQAITRCRDKLSEDPTFPKAQHMLGMLLEATDQDSNLEEIAEMSYEAGSCDDRPLEPQNRVDSLVRAGKTFLQMGRTDRAVSSYQKALTLAEDQTVLETILHQVTPLLFQETIDPAMGLSPLASILTERFPSSSVIHQFQGAVHRKSGNLEAAFQSYHKASLSPSESQTESYILAASAARQAGRDLDTQLRYLQQALDASDNNQDLLAEVWNNMGIAYKKAGQKEQAIGCFQSALTAKPGDGHALAQLASLDATQSATTFDADYVQGLFDGYSSRFEDELVNVLEYKGHEWVAQELVRHWEEGNTAGSASIVDLGCGTGLVGEVLASQLKTETPPTLIGVDLSSRMVEMTRVRTLGDTRLYKQVVQEDACAFLKSLDPGSVSAIVAADVFIYVGDLEGVFSASWDALSSMGLLVFSIELTKEGMTLLSSGRFGHSKGYVEGLAKRTGFNIKLWKEGVLRKQHGTPVQGAVVVLQRKAGV